MLSSPKRKEWKSIVASSEDRRTFLSRKIPRHSFGIVPSRPDRSVGQSVAVVAPPRTAGPSFQVGMPEKEMKIKIERKKNSQATTFHSLYEQRAFSCVKGRSMKKHTAWCCGAERRRRKFTSWKSKPTSTQPNWRHVWKGLKSLPRLLGLGWAGPGQAILVSCDLHLMMYHFLATPFYDSRAWFRKSFVPLRLPLENICAELAFPYKDEHCSGRFELQLRLVAWLPLLLVFRNCFIETIYALDWQTNRWQKHF